MVVKDALCEIVCDCDANRDGLTEFDALTVGVATAEGDVDRECDVLGVTFDDAESEAEVVATTLIDARTDPDSEGDAVNENERVLLDVGLLVTEIVKGGEPPMPDREGVAVIETRENEREAETDNDGVAS